MFGRQDSGGWIEGYVAEEWQTTPDPDVVDASLAKLSFWDEEGAPSNVCWPYLFDADPAEILDAREFQKMQLARYAKQSLTELEKADVSQIREWIRQLNKLLEAEHEFTKATED